MKLLETVDGNLIEHQAILSAHQQAMLLLQQTLSQPTQVPLTHQVMPAVTTLHSLIGQWYLFSVLLQHISCLQKVSMMVCCVSLCYPRYFFQKQQSTAIKVSQGLVYQQCKCNRFNILMSVTAGNITGTTESQ